MTHSISIETIQFSNGNRSRMIQPAYGTLASQIVDALALPAPRGLVILNGGTAQLEADRKAWLAAALADGLARLVAEESLTAITGGTDAGIFHLFGQGLGRWGRTAPCIGVAVRSLVCWPGQPAGEAPLEPHHSHFVLVEGERWGDETETMYALAAELGDGCPSVAVFAGGGEIAIHEMLVNVAQGRSMILLAGSGRVTDAVLAARRGQSPDDPRIAQIAGLGKIIAHDVASAPSTLVQLVSQAVASPSIATRD
jgi:hypothetical protein